MLNDASGRSHHLALAEVRDLVLAKSKFGQHFFGLLAELRWACHHLAWRARQLERLADELDVPVLVIGHMLGYAEMLHLRVVTTA